MLRWKPLRSLRNHAVDHQILRGEFRSLLRYRPVPSSVIQTFGYDEDERRLTVRFVSGLVYAYAGVPAEIVAGLRAASSKGHYFTECIRDRFTFTRLRAGWLGPETSERGAAEHRKEQ